MHGVVCLCADLLFVCEMAVGNVLCCAVMVGVYVHALAFVDARVRYSCGVLAVRVCIGATMHRACGWRLWGRWARA